MKRTFKAVTAAALMSALMTSLLTGCGGGSDSSAPPDDGGSAPPPPSPSPSRFSKSASWTFALPAAAGSLCYDFDAAVARIAAAARAVRGPFVLTARAENFLHGRPDLDDTIRSTAAGSTSRPSRGTGSAVT